MKKFQIAAIGMFAALGLSSTAIAQKASAPNQGMTVKQHRQMMSGASQKGSGSMMMKDAEMAKMMESCEKMMGMMNHHSMQMQKAPSADAKR